MSRRLHYFEWDVIRFGILHRMRLRLVRLAEPFIRNQVFIYF